MNWELGRKGTGYFKMKLCSAKWPIPWDLYILKYPPKAFIDWHVDAIEAGKHYRLNLMIRSAVGGDFYISGEHRPIYKSKYLNIFRPDIHHHSVGYVFRGTRYVISLGWVI